MPNERVLFAIIRINISNNDKKCLKNDIGGGIIQASKIIS